MYSIQCEHDSIYLVSNKQSLGRIIKKHNFVIAENFDKKRNQLTYSGYEEIGMFIDKQYVMKIKII